MSEAEKKRRDRYKQNRSKWIMILSILLAVWLLLGVIFTAAYAYVNQEYYINYTESSNVDYTVKLKENDFYGDPVLGKDQTYVSSLIDSVFANFRYNMTVDTENVEYHYSYRAEAQLLITDDLSKEAIFDPIEVLKEEKGLVQNTNDPLKINEFVAIDYEKYNDLANRFISTYDLDKVKSTLIVRLYVNVHSNCDSHADTTVDEHVIALSMPLAVKTVDIQMTAGAVQPITKTIACDMGAKKMVFKVLGILFAVLSILHAAFTVAFMYLTKTRDITYANTVQKLLSRYRSYVQKINNEFDMYGFQLLRVNSFDEMLEIRETIQEPILMYENEDKTCSQFIIPTNTMLVYLFEVKVEGYEEIYGTEQETVAEQSDAEVSYEDETVEEPVEEPIITKEEPDNGVEAINVTWPESPEHKSYRYDPNGETVEEGDVVLVPSRDEHSKKDIVREAEVTKGNYRVDPATLHHPLKKIIRVVRRKAEQVFTAMIDSEASTEAETKSKKR